MEYTIYLPTGNKQQTVAWGRITIRLHWAVNVESISLFSLLIYNFCSSFLSVFYSFDIIAIDVKTGGILGQYSFEGQQVRVPPFLPTNQPTNHFLPSFFLSCIIGNNIRNIFYLLSNTIGILSNSSKWEWRRGICSYRRWGRSIPSLEMYILWRYLEISLSHIDYYKYI